MIRKIFSVLIFVIFINQVQAQENIMIMKLKDGEVCPRNVLKKTLELLKELGFKGKSALEYEFFLFNETPHSVREKDFQNLASFTPGM